MFTGPGRCSIYTGNPLPWEDIYFKGRLTFCLFAFKENLMKKSSEDMKNVNVKPG